MYLSFVTMYLVFGMGYFVFGMGYLVLVIVFVLLNDIQGNDDEYNMRQRVNERRRVVHC